ncbi:hypothetical protein [Nonomuraea basaltis]|uniref:hypothetical protein n=1 Tax=Nonomuraea basaltis TaxID=2495887 RepID=UPI001486AA0C|nr:hypothetical protein [Nonomuraea basaltis]
MSTTPKTTRVLAEHIVAFRLDGPLFFAAHRFLPAWTRPGKCSSLPRGHRRRPRAPGQSRHPAFAPSVGERAVAQCLPDHKPGPAGPIKRRVEMRAEGVVSWRHTCPRPPHR